MYGYIYMITNKVNGKIYIGKHQYIGPGLDPNYFASGKIINEAVNKYGRENFDVAMLSTADTLDELNAKEAAYIKEYNSQDLSVGYNLTCGGDGGNTVVGKIKITNGVDEYWHDEKLPLPEGFWKGSKMCGNKHPQYGKQYIWANNGEKEITLPVDDVSTIEYYRSLGYIIGKRLPMSEQQKALLSAHHNTYKENFSEETLNKFRDAWLGDNNPNRKNPKYGNDNPFYGKHRSEISKQKNREAHMVKYHCPFCNYVSNKGSVTKHIRKWHKDLTGSASTIESISYEKYIGE